MKLSNFVMIAACPLVAGALWYGLSKAPQKTSEPRAHTTTHSVEDVLTDADKVLKLAESVRNLKVDEPTATPPSQEALSHELSEPIEQLQGSVALLEESNEQLKELDTEYEAIQKRKKAGDKSKEVLEAEAKHFEKRQAIINQLALSLKANEHSDPK